ncbi:hypothetical protein HELRODRAFT_194830 [Helobdella robusta]|uniref:Major facilitator superfamily (MFS) profile domain-containing protein n=1 Tax=Helobdella robusta TaxID=6412 RepID=T1FWG6_HELRO|nr:hypothetical protein HELRODRAFT_194830 [Helobdella robusta]ESO11368.1 hypothetical protein HELRODRAFT_194830 [Helobdella robusta]
MKYWPPISRKCLRTYRAKMLNCSKRFTRSSSSSNPNEHHSSSSALNDRRKGFHKPTVYHVLIVIFLEFFSWGLLISVGVRVLEMTFMNNAFLMNGLIQGVKGILSFLSAPLVGALSDIWGRKPFMLLTVSFTCCPIPFMKSSPIWYFTLTSLSGVMAVTFSIVFAYVADITTKENRSSAYGLVSATFAASLVVSPYIGTVLERYYGDDFVVFVASVVATIDIIFILIFVPETLPWRPGLCKDHEEDDDTVTMTTTMVMSDVIIAAPSSGGGAVAGGGGGGGGGSGSISRLSWEKADPFASLRKIGHDKLIVMLALTVFLSYLPEAGEYSSIFVYLQIIMDFSPDKVAGYVAMVGVLSYLVAIGLMRHYDNKTTVIVGLVFETVQHFLFGLFSQHWVLFVAGGVAALGSITYPAISVYVSARAKPEQQGASQGVITGIRGLCNGLGPAMFGFIFYLFKVDITSINKPSLSNNINTFNNNNNITTTDPTLHSKLIIPGPPFVFGGFLVMVAIIVASYMPEPLGSCHGNRDAHGVESSVTRGDILLEPMESSQVDKTPLLDTTDDSDNNTSQSSHVV